MTNKNIVIGAIAVLVVVGGAAVIFMSGARQSVVDTAALTGDERELAAFKTDLNTFAKDEAVLSESDRTFDEIAGKTSSIKDAEALDGASINKEWNEVDSSEDLTAFASDTAAVQVHDSAFGEVSQ